MRGLYLSDKQNDGSNRSRYSGGSADSVGSARVVDEALRAAKASSKASTKASTQASTRGDVGLLQQLPRQAVRYLQI